VSTLTTTCPGRPKRLRGHHKGTGELAGDFLPTDFDTSPDQSAGPVAVEVTLPAPIASYRLDWGDPRSGAADVVTGTTAVALKPKDFTSSHQYTASGTYQITLAVTDFLGRTITVTESVDVLISPPQAAFGASSTEILPAQPVSFDGSQSQPGGGGPIVGWSWDFGDGTNGSGTTVQHAYASPGTYTVELVVTDQAGQSSDPATSEITVDGP
jgi:PKD repeat protein